MGTKVMEVLILRTYFKDFLTLYKAVYAENYSNNL